MMTPEPGTAWDRRHRYQSAPDQREHHVDHAHVCGRIGAGNQARHMVKPKPKPRTPSLVLPQISRICRICSIVSAVMTWSCASVSGR